MALTEQFPVGLRVLVVDDDITCLKILEQMLRRCLYTVTLCSQATFALKLLRESADCFDMVLSDVHMPDMDGYKLLEHVGLEMNLPVIMMSADESTSAVMRGIRHGACDYLIKPIRQEELNNLWQHVARKRWNETKSLAHALSPEVDDPQKHGNDAAVFASSQNESTEGSMRIQKAKRDSREDDDSELDNDDPSSSKKPRVVWSVELHQQFVNVVNQLGLDKAVPKRILELMNVPGLTRENVASHLQKFRLYLKRLSGGTYQGSICNALYGPFDPNARFDVQTLSASGQLSSQTLEALHAELLGYTAYDQSVQMQTEQLQKYSERPKPVPVQDTAQILAKNRAYAPRILSQPRIPSGNISPGHGAWPPSAVESAASGENQVEGLTKEDNSCGDTSRLQHWQPAVPVRNQSIIVQPSCLVASQSSSTVDAAYDNLSSNQVSTSSRNLSIDYGSLSQQSPGAGPYSALDLRRRGLGSYPLGAVVSPSISSCPIVADSFSLDQLLLKESYKNSSAVPSFPSRFAVEVDPLLDSSGSRKINDLTKANCVKAESDFDWGSNANSDASGFEYSRLNDLSHIL